MSSHSNRITIEEYTDQWGYNSFRVFDEDSNQEQCGLNEVDVIKAIINIITK